MVKGIGNNVLILGIGGISLSAIAEILIKNGHVVSGYDQTRSDITQKLEKKGVLIKYNKVNSLKTFDTIIYSSAFDDDYFLLRMGRELGLQVISRADALGVIAQDYMEVVAVSGSHGKTTTTSLISSILNHSNLDFSAHIGGELVEWDSNVKIGEEKKIFITEACEYKKSFHKLTPTIGVILNLDLDHIDIYGSEDEIVSAYTQFANNIVDGGTLIINIDDNRADGVIKNTIQNKSIITYSIKSNLADYYIDEIVQKFGVSSFNVWRQGELLGRINYNQSGEYNLYNALCSIAVMTEMDVPFDVIGCALENFKGVKRRYQKVGEINGATVILDYAHHPVEIKKVISETKKNTKGKVFVVFQSHTYSRTKYFWSEFVKSLSLADSIVLYPIYPAREKAIKGVSASRMAEDLRRIKKVCYYSNDFNKIVTYLGYFVSKTDKVLILGAGNIEKIVDVIKSCKK